MHLWLWWSSSVHVDAADDSLNPGDTLNSSSQPLYSKSRKYFLDFYSLGRQGEFFTYLSIKSAYDNLVAWDANREQSVNQSDPVLSLNFSGVLKINIHL